MGTSNLLAYTLSLTCNQPTSSLNSNNYFFTRDKTKNVLVFSNSAQPTRAQYSLNSTQPVAVRIYGSSLGSQYYTPNPNKIICMPSQPSNAQWILLFIDTNPSKTTLSTFNFDLYIDNDTSACTCYNG